MLRHYMGIHWQENHVEVVPELVEQPGAFVREVALQARMLAAHERKTEVSLDLLRRSVDSLLVQMRSDKDFLMQRRPLGLGYNSRRTRFNSRDEF